jgi:hypothetical protein
MKMAQINSKWPLLLVTGKPVTEEQADDILLRSDSQWLQGNDRAWQEQVGAILGIEMGKWAGLDFASAEKWRAGINAVSLQYLGNARIMSSWIGGPNGWCDWDGRIGCGSWNIGKWPDVEGVEADLAAIAAAWPFLDMRVQLVDGEGEGDLCGEWRVWDGRMMETEPGPLISEPGLDHEAAAFALIYDPWRERGVTPERLASACARVRAAQGGEGLRP